MKRKRADAWVTLTASVISIVAGCSSGSRTTRPTTRPKSDRPHTRATTQTAPSHSPAVSKPAEEATTRPAVGRLLRYLKDKDPNSRLQAAIALGRLGEPEAMWPLIQAGANDPDPNVRPAAAEGVTWLSPDPNSWLCRAVRERLLDRRTGPLSMRSVDFGYLLFMSHERADTSFCINWRTLQVEGVGPSRKVSADWPSVPLAEALCRACAASGGQMCFSISRPGPPLYFTSPRHFIGQVRTARRCRARGAAIRKWSASTEVGRRTLDAIQSSIRFPKIDGAKFADVIQYLRETSSVEFVVDWAELKKVRVEKSTLLRAEHYPRAGNKIARSLPPSEKGLWALLDAMCREVYAEEGLDFVVDGKAVFISTGEGVERRMAARGRPMPRLVPTKADEEQQAIGRLIAAMKNKDPVVRRSVAWALGELRAWEAMRVLIEAAAGDSDAGVRLTAAGAVICLPCEVGEPLRPAVQRKLLGRPVERLKFDGIALRDIVQFLREDGAFPIHCDWRALKGGGIDGSRKITIDAQGVTVAEALCRLAAAAGPDVGLAVDRDGVTIAPVRNMPDPRPARRAGRARREAWRTFAVRTAAGRRTLDKLERDIERLSLVDTDFGDVLRFLQGYSDVNIRVDWRSLKAVGIQPNTKVSVDVRKIAVGRAIDLLLRDVSGAAPGADAELDYLVDGETVFISTRKEINRRIDPRGAEPPSR